MSLSDGQAWENEYGSWSEKAKQKRKEKLESTVKEKIAGVLGLTDEWEDGTYLYNLTRVKEAFNVGTMTLDDFVEIDEELVEEIFEAIKPFLKL
ncbi:hypothetical protein [Bacillus sp. T33-2]|uniref:hypothetical protein n=1 Tax=Bacillus sp. T33-2 TaxID=2054168 RepID=UPI000C77106C|nr:hypothetical protein [Bacillus sp. T33-2]PLR99540.1 hypothetical protein CVD19_00320 [Bacillus sp. T33-2]